MKILVLSLPGIGDSLMATPLIRQLRLQFPDAVIDIACMFDGVKFVYKNNPNVNTIYRLFLYKENPINALRQLLPLRKRKYDISILTFPSYRREYHLVQWVIGARKRLAHRFLKGYIAECNFLDTDLIDVDYSVHNVINNLSLLNALNVNWQANTAEDKLMYDLELDKKDTTFAKKYIQSLGWEKNNIIGIHPGSTKSKAALYKRWPIKRYSELAAYLIKHNSKVLIFAGGDEKEVGVELYNMVQDEANCKLVPDMQLGQAAGIVEQMDVMICNDNGFAHIANGLKVPSIILFGPTNPQWCSPYNKQYATVLRKATFDPWFRNDMKVTHPPENVRSGMEDIAVQDVIHVFKKNFQNKK